MPELEELLSKLESEDKTVIKTTLEQLGDLGDEKAVPQLLKMLDRINDEDLLESILWTLSRIASTKTLIELLNHSNELIIVEVLDALGRREELESVDEIIPFLIHQNGEVRSIATWALGKISVKRTYDSLLNLLKTDEDPLVRANAAWAIGKFDNSDSIPFLTERLSEESDESVRYNLEEAIHRLEELKDPWQKGLKATIYECPKFDPKCLENSLQTETRSDNFIKIEIVVCESCSLSKICRVNLIRKINQ
ncbi:MAG: HEAT repeat domain-containing protein [Candidatus Helarchaeota archaeon]|nr:HEAT repeat domain-containing protein [Candidatus Helarchaeota archaeon]